MELITLEGFKNYLKSDVFKLQPTQKKLCFPIIQRIYHKMKVGVQFDNIRVKDDLVINGRHRYICSLLSNKGIDISPWSRPSPIIVCSWREIEIDLFDWESKEEIEHHNRMDAFKSGLNINELEAHL